MRGVKISFVSSAVTGDTFFYRVRIGQENATGIPCTHPVTSENQNIGCPLHYEYSEKRGDNHEDNILLEYLQAHNVRDS